MNMTIAFVGAGNMAQAMIGGFLGEGIERQDLLVVDPDEQQLLRVRDAYGVQACKTTDGRLAKAALVVWAVKPQALRLAAERVAGSTTAALHLSVAAGIRLCDLVRWLHTPRVVRAMPNTSALVRAGVTGLQAGSGVTPEDRKRVERLLQGIGRILWVGSDEEMDAITAVSGSGPAYVFHFLESLQQAAVRLGFAPATARDLALWVTSGAVQQAAAAQEPLDELRRRVTSRGGTTEAALELLHSRGTQEALVDAVCAAAARARELGAEMSGGGGVLDELH